MSAIPGQDLSWRGRGSSEIASTSTVALLSHELASELGHLPARKLLEKLIREVFPDRIALVSSFGIEAAVLLHIVAEIDPATPVIFLDTGKLFAETIRYRNTLVRILGLQDVRSIEPDQALLRASDPNGGAWRSNPDLCCHIRKVEPLARSLAGFKAWINGRKRHHGGPRSALPLIEAVDGRIKINALAAWGAEEIEAYFSVHQLPRHPLGDDGYRSIGCMPCSDRVAPGEDIRAGRWRGREKTECGIHQTSSHHFANPREE
ncbi:MAG: phosphoadenylyl-sulfate reductase [Proteobacteria bacterium]|nr:phosphoadenylyl-sulfate reductase [Pseudomonadota bacterium]MBI3498693.1 phosphoadenylyl-sulfate reductase [Pseudomonadota bacterium]